MKKKKRGSLLLVLYEEIEKSLLAIGFNSVIN